MNHPLKGDIGPTGRAGMDGHRGEKGETGVYLHNKYLFLPAVYTLFSYTFNSILPYLYYKQVYNNREVYCVLDVYRCGWPGRAQRKKRR